MQDLNWNDLRHVLAVARCQSLTAAARQLGVNESTVGRRVTQAEQRLGARLFERTNGVYHPTEAGRVAVASAERIELEIQSVEESISGVDRLAAGSVRVTSVPIIVNRVLMPALPSLLRTHPQLRVELIAEPRNLSLIRREADIALRLARPQNDSRAIARRIGRLDYAEYAPAHKTTQADALPWITYDDSMVDLPQMGWMAERSLPIGAQPPVTVNDAEAILQGVKAGLGRSLLPIAIADREPGLVRSGDDAPPLSRELWLLVHPELRDLTRIRVVTDWLMSTVHRMTNATSPASGRQPPT